MVIILRPGWKPNGFVRDVGCATEVNAQQNADQLKAGNGHAMVLCSGICAVPKSEGDSPIKLYFILTRDCGEPLACLYLRLGMWKTIRT